MSHHQLALTTSLFTTNAVTLFRKRELLCIKGPLGILFLKLPLDFQIKKIKSQPTYTYLKPLVPRTYVQLLEQKIRGVLIGFFEILVICGVGWKLNIKHQQLLFYLGYSHPITYNVPAQIEITLLDSTNQQFKVFGVDYAQVQQVVSDLSQLRLFNCFTGKGLYKSKKVFRLKSSSKSKS